MEAREPAIADVRCHRGVVHLVRRFECTERLLTLALWGHQRPDDFLRAEVGGHTDL